MSNLIDIILPVFILMAIGYIAVRTGWFSDAGADSLLKFSQNVCHPVLAVSGDIKPGSVRRF